MTAKLKHSAQRDVILSCLCSRYDHPTADDVYHTIREVQPHISLGTVYRNLSLLCDIGKAQRIVTGDGREHFDGNVRPHDHFRCRICGCVQDIPGTERSAADDISSFPVFSGKIEQKSILYIGVCQDCLMKEAAAPKS